MDDEDQLNGIPSLVPYIVHLESLLAEAEQDPDKTKTLFLSLTEFELALVQAGLFWLAKIYPPELVLALAEKIRDVVDVQEFCECEHCRDKRDKERNQT